MNKTYYKYIDPRKEGIRKAYLWSALTAHLQLICFYYEEGSQLKTVFTRYLATFYKAIVDTISLLLK